jgi:hypothetical protein
VNQPIRSKDILVAFAKTAAINFTRNKVPLNESLSKIARDEGLIPDQVRYLVQETNKHTWGDLYKTNKDAAYEFPLADSDKVLDMLKDDFSTKSIKGYDLDYMMEPMKKVAAKTMEKVASAEGRSKKEIARDLTRQLEKLAYARNDFQMQWLEQNTMAENVAEKLVKDLKNELAPIKFTERHDAFKKFAAAAVKHVPGIATIEKLSGIKYALEKLGVMMKSAALEAPEQYISKNMPAEIINGNNVLMIRVKTLMQYNNAAKDAHSRMSLVDDTIPKVKEAIREL